MGLRFRQWWYFKNSLKTILKGGLFFLKIGFKPGQRKVLFTCFKRNDKREVKVAQLAGSVAEMSAYHHGEVSVNKEVN